MHLALVALAWAAYGALHSLLASRRFKAAVAARWPDVMPAYRLTFNAVSTLLLAPPLALAASYAGPLVWDVPAWIGWPAAGIAAAGFLWSLRWYDGAAFLGLTQWRARQGPDDAREAFTLSPLHRHVRHPWYALGLLFLWTRDMNAAWLVTAVIVTVYLAVGSRLEEAKLIALHGEAYRRYRRRVPGLIPLPGRSLSAAEAAALERLAREINGAEDPRAPASSGAGECRR